MKRIVTQLESTLRSAIRQEAEERLKQGDEYIYFCLAVGTKEVELTLTPESEELHIFAEDGRQLTHLGHRLEHLLPTYHEAMYEAWREIN